MLSSCTTEQIPENTLQSIAFVNNADESDYTVMIKEYNEYVPYLVLTDDYNETKTCMLLRKNLLDDYHIYNENVNDAGYYGNSEIDRFLNNEVYKSYTNELQNLILTTKLEVTSKESLEFGAQNVREINRKIFLLSNTEAGYYSDSSRLKEGEWIKYFNSGERRIAAKENGDIASWWLRTPNAAYENVVLGVSVDGISCSGGIAVLGDIWEDGVRPAFCLPRDTAIVCVDGVNYIEEDYNSLDVMNVAEDRTELLYDNIYTFCKEEFDNSTFNNYRPNDYRKYIEDALAIVMESNKADEEYKYHVFIDSPFHIEWQDVVFEINNSAENNIYLNMDYWMCLDNSQRIGCYYYVFTAKEIEVLTEYEIYCHYVGSGEGSLENANWDTTEGILEYCELYGDGYVAQ